MKKILMDPMLLVITFIIILVIYGICSDTKNVENERSEKFDRTLEYYHNKEKEKYNSANIPDWSSKVKGVVTQ